jgi:hypothetical protein
LSEEELRRKSEGLFQEYTSTLDKAEAVTCVKELNTPVSDEAGGGVKEYMTSSAFKGAHEWCLYSKA